VTASVLPSSAPPDAGGPRAQSLSRSIFRTVRAAGFEIALIFGLLTFYERSRSLASGHIEQAERNANHLWSIERSMHLLNEVHVQQFLLQSTTLVLLSNRYYVTVHFPITAIFLSWLFLRHRSSYRKVRNTLVLLTTFGLLFTVFVPLAPPRLFTGDTLIDTMQVFGPSAYNPDSTTGVANQYAAMPSLHVAWAVLIAITVIRVSKRRIRWLALAHPVITIFVVVATGNHYWLDGIVGLMLLGFSAMVVYRWRWFTATGQWLARGAGYAFPAIPPVPGLDRKS